VTPTTEEPAGPRPGVAVAGDSAGGQRF
jgi:hypothetical protein